MGIEVPYISVFLIFIAVWAVYRFIIHKKSDNITLIHEIVLNIFFLYILAVIFITFFKPGGSITLSLKDYGKMANIIPIAETLRSLHFEKRYALYNIFGNILLFVPFGFFVPTLFEKGRKFYKILILSAITSVMIEFLQYFTMFNVSDIDDVIFNVSGAAAGYLLFKLLNTKMHSFFEKIKSSTDKNLIVLAVKPLSIMIALSIMLCIYCIYRQTYSGKLSDNKIAAEVFSDYKCEKPKTVLVMNTENRRFILNDYGRYLELMELKKVFLNRFIQNEDPQLNLRNNKCGYNVFTEYDNKKINIIVYGKNDDSANTVVSFDGKEYKNKLIKNDYFIVCNSCPVSGKMYKYVPNDIEIKFTGENGKKDTEMQKLD